MDRFQSMIKRVEVVINNNPIDSRNKLVDAIVKHKFQSKGHLYAVICALFEEQGIKPSASGTAWEDCSQDERDLRTVYSQCAKKLGFL